MGLKERLNRFLDELEAIDETETLKIESVQAATTPQITPQSVKATSFVDIDLTKPVNLDKSTSIIDKDARIFGNVSTSSSLHMNGELFGDVLVGNHLQLQGIIEGDIKAQSMDMKVSRVQGNVSCEEDLFVDENSSIYGDCWNRSLSLRGLIKGNIYAKEKVKLFGTAQVFGNVSARNIVVDDGAILQGNIKIKRD